MHVRQASQDSDKILQQRQHVEDRDGTGKKEEFYNLLIPSKMATPGYIDSLNGEKIYAAMKLYTCFYDLSPN